MAKEKKPVHKVQMTEVEYEYPFSSYFLHALIFTSVTFVKIGNYL